MRQIRVSAWAIQNPIPVVVLFAALTLAGIFAYLMLPVKQFPDASFPAVSVTVTQNGASPAELETQVTRPVEDAIAGISGIKDIRSAISLGASVTTINFEIGEDQQRAKDEVESAIDQIRATLPREIDEPIIERVDIESQPILTYAVEAPGMSVPDLSWFIDDTVGRALLGQEGVAQVSRVGGAEREINVIVDLERLAGFGLTVPQLNDAIRQVSVNAAGGRLEVGGREQTVRIVGQADTEQRLRDLSISLPGGRYVRLADVAEIGAGAAEARQFARLDGRPVVGFQVLKTKEGSDVEVEDGLRIAIADLERAHPQIRFTKVLSTVDETRASFEATIHVLIEGMLLAALVVFLFLRDWRSTMIAAVAMPLSLVPTFAAMLLFGFSLNVVTLLGLTLVIGILVDDAIVEIENIEKRIERGQRPYQAAMEGADAIGLAVVATTAAIVVVFAPVSAMPGMAGQFFKEFGLTVAVAVLASLAVARFVTPLMAAYLLKPGTKTHAPEDLRPWYRRVLTYALDHRKRSILLGTLLFIGSVAMMGLLPASFQPSQNFDYVNLTVQGAPGATRADMEGAVRDTTAVLKRRPEVANVFASIGSGASGGFGQGATGGDLRTGTIIVVLHHERDLSSTEFRDAVRPSLRAVTGARLSFLGDWGTAELPITLTGDDGTVLARATEQLRREMGQLPEVRDPRPAALPAAPEVQIVPRPAEMARLGVSSETLATAARLATIGDINANVAKATQGERRIPITVRLPESQRTEAGALAALPIPTASGAPTTLGSVADIRFEAGPAQIDRFDRRRQQTIEANLGEGVALGSAVAAVNNLPIMKNLPPGIKQAETGDAEALSELLSAMGLVIAAGVLMLYGVMVLLFGSFFKPVTILSALPLAIGGAVLGLLVTGLDLSLPAMIGFLMLLGLAAKNSILLVEYAIEREREGMSQREALLEACRERARPIIMTTFAMAAGMLPTALGLGAGAEFRQPMAVAVIGGLITSTALSLVLVPVIYEFVDDFEAWLRPKLTRFVTPREAATEVVA
ncbi:efflux RND transporter permease subunit [Sphingomonas sp.]|jgi:HAE1 family hydrophobic/amphiphilic exporter-1|uniref:efflux RND transporter permease subunit n=1 Tax=Sphingomonas sp. TaxID=28214 RepID=UPI002D7F5F85|nr:efflux RND transporter permease subunit [Sphingomonas sp.]HEU0043125.1 efflux RND transporter permease subunit [Sphingomonas sp.]